MLNFSSETKRIDFTLTDTKGETHELYVGEFTVGDMTKLADLQRPLLEDKNGMSDAQVNTLFTCSRIVCSVKVATTGQQFWSSVDDIMVLPSATVVGLRDVVNDVNPFDTVEKTNEKKSK